ncbi:magnesium chelatase subunit D [Streptomyces sp. 840.1]|uniref:hypothetical protein n=1 Tax=Streptomyces sp. 840.1 TaxID=2485152 RepID=UPI000F463BEF|nr:hypothetical protein [Streptomyces sp. 840.1]ROQ66084.1 magnesium chelatase subunit D [Streptomyces sp. 840.1]
MSARPPQTQDPEERDDAAHRLLTALVCSALEPGLTGVLLFDLPSEQVPAVARVFAEVLGTACGRPPEAVPRTTLDAATADDDLWSRPLVRRGSGGIEFTLGPGPLAETGDVPPLVVVPDLARLSVPGMRAAVQLLGADTATLEHSGIRRRWTPRARWLAFCRSEDAAHVSPHLLDRFAVRLGVPGLRLRPGPGPLGPLPAAWAAALSPRTPRRPATLADGFAASVLEHLDDREGPGHRRALALGRIARALARLDAAQERAEPLGDPATAATTTAPVHVAPAHVDRAARLIRLRTVHRPPAPPPASAPAPEPPRAPGPGPGRPLPDHPAGPEPPPGTGPFVREPEAAVSLGPAPAPVRGAAPGPLTPYPEDGAGPGPDGATLRIPARRTAGTRASRGAVVGVRRARDLWDLAPVRTAMEAAKYRAIRGGQGSLVILPQDLRGYVRAPEPVRMLTLVLDHTCRGDWDWRPALEPFLQWAYVTRAAVHVVEVGARGAANELRAGSFSARSTRDPRIAAALGRPAGRATPLAHGLDQAGSALRRAFRHHRAGLVEALLVVVTDGRGNVPLTEGRTGRRERGPAGRTGTTDAMRAAERIGALGGTRLHSVVIDPGRRPYTALPAELADALGADVIAARADDEGAGRA